VLLVRRNPEASFMPGVWVFPGGVVEADERVPGELSAGGAADAEELAHRACAMRELGEEAGIELPGDTELLPWSRWITPEVVPVRFDTRFYVALAPPHSPPKPDGAEITEAAWISPREALERHAAGEQRAHERHDAAESHVVVDAAARLARGVALDELGAPVLDPVVRRTPEARRLEDGAIAGEVITVDRFGNLVTNLVAPRGGTVSVGGRVVGELARTYADAAGDGLVALVGSSGLVEIAMRDGSAARALGVGRGAPVLLRPADQARPDGPRR
jgi:8-oxo-dGTP pyrophosphatase MutT (NUDIX family)